MVSAAHQVISGAEHSSCLTLFGCAGLLNDARQEGEKQLKKHPEKKSGN